ncbi:MAG: ester cyclase [Ignavibacteriales bacterium]
MANQENAKIARTIYDAFNRRDFDSALKYIDKNIEITNVPANMVMHGTDGFLQFLHGWETAFPDAKVDIKNQISCEDAVVTEFTGTGTHKGTFKTPEGDLSGTNKPVKFQLCDVVTIKNGKVTQIKSYFDLASVLRQIGYMPELRHH